jgi:N6-adenosine-specific RNA methylase IME4
MATRPAQEERRLAGAACRPPTLAARSAAMDERQSAEAVAALREHRAAGVVPEMREAEYALFLADVRERGVLEPLTVTTEGIVLDGRHRLRAARELRLERLPVRVIAAVGDEVEFMVRAAASRRQLSESRRAVMAVEFASYQADRERGIERQRANLRNARVEGAGLPPRGGKARDRAAALVGVSGRLIQDAQTLQRTNSDLFAQVKDGELSVHKATRELKRRRRYATIQQPPPLPAGAFDLIYADPPWQLGNPDSPFAPEQHYPTLPLEEIKQLPVPAAENAVLFLWVPASLIPEALEVISAWGFDYRTELCWDKQSVGPGQWLRNQHEPLLLATRGKYPPPQAHQRVSSVLQAPRRGHSRKPHEMYERIEQMYPNAQRRLELYARGRPRPSWTTWGNQTQPADEAAA